ncbi:MAG: glycosyltransferase [Candidatus Poseidoniaceae archaeon]|nr:glycosyltransferase [Candidatus Poseidoniaceae archaeon]
MNIIWFSGRKMADLCSTTQKSLGSGLVERGHNLIFVNPDLPGSHTNYPWTHYSITASQIPGLKSITLARKMNKWLCANLPKDKTVVILDWRIAKQLTMTLQKHNIPWILMDRSPPADSNILAKLQWLYWKNAWKSVKTYQKTGCVVSQAHREFVSRYTGVSQSSTISIPAGVNTNQFQTGIKSSPIKLCYHGKLDSNRGLMKLISIHSKLIDNGVDVKLYLHGNGDLVTKLANLKNDKIHVTETLDSDNLVQCLSGYDVGLLPMPDKRVWRLASPLKRGEYLASGMIVLGINHTGHRMDNSENWLHLFDENKFVQSSVDFIRNLDLEQLRQSQTNARNFAEANLDWSNSVAILEDILSKQY